MADKFDLELLDKGYEAWIEQYPRLDYQFVPDLTNADLSGRKLTGWKFMGVDFRGANFVGADLSNSEFYACSFSGCNFTKAVLFKSQFTGAEIYSDFEDALFNGAQLDEASFLDCNIHRSILRNASCMYTSFTYCSFDNTSFKDASFLNTVFLSCDFRGVSDLDKVEYIGDNFVDHATIVTSWPLPKIFLRGCSLPDNYIDYLPSLLNQPIQFYSCFISYADKNREFVDRLHNDMQGSGVRVWYAPEDLKTGDKLHPTFDHAIRLHDKLLIILSEQSLASPWVEDEVNRALAKERDRKRKGDDSPVLFPIMIDNAVMDSEEAWATYIKDNRHIGDFRDWKNHDSYRKAFDRLMRDLKPAIMRMPGGGAGA